MIYQHLPPIGSLVAPELAWMPSPNFSSRNGTQIQITFSHRWSGGTFDENVAYLRNPRKDDPQAAVSSHAVYAGELGPDKGKGAQLVAWSQKAWTECDLNPRGISVEFADAIWLGQDPEGFARAARMVALILHLHGLPPRWVGGPEMMQGMKGHARHADAGALGCGHLYCPTTDLALFQQFNERVIMETRLGGFRKSYGKS